MPMILIGLPRKLRLAPLWPALAAVLTATPLLWVLLPGLFEQTATVQLDDTLHILTPIVREREEASDTGLQEWLRRLAADSDLRITLIAKDGTVLADSSVPAYRLPQLENHANRPEVRAALSKGAGSSIRESDTTGHTYVYSARAFTDSRGRVLILRLAEPLEELQVLRGRLAAAMILATAVAGVAIFITALWINRRIFEPFYRLIDGAGDLASGRLSRVEVPDEEELANLAHALNHLAATAEAQFAAVSHERDHLKII